MKIALVSTGGTIEKDYDDSDGQMSHCARCCVLDVILDQLRLEGIDQLFRVPLMCKDSLHMSDADHQQIVDCVCDLCHDDDDDDDRRYDAVIVVHGTDRLEVSGERVYDQLHSALTIPVVFTGAMRPYVVNTSDALQNVTEALLAVQLLAPGVYTVMHSRVLAFPGVTKDRMRRTFVKNGQE